MTHWQVARRHWIPGFRLAAVTRETIVNLAIPEGAVSELPGCSFHQELYTVDRRRLQRHVRREYLSIRRAIDDLRASKILLDQIDKLDVPSLVRIKSGQGMAYMADADELRAWRSQNTSGADK